MINREERKKQTAEVFTPPELVNTILDKLPKSVWEENKTFLDPTCGNGNILIEVLKRKIKYGHDPVKALSTIYGVDIMPDNIAECKLRLKSIVGNSSQIDQILNNNIREGDALKYKFNFSEEFNLF
jgi:type I restriction-modification system DNA methylase subunit